MKLEIFAAFSFVLLLAFISVPQPVLAVENDGHDGWSRTNADEIRLDGQITHKSLAQFQDVAEGGFKRIVLNSGGGREFAAMRIALDPRYADADIVVSEKCLSACANFLALLGRSLTVKCDSIIGFHGTALTEYKFHLIKKEFDYSILNNNFNELSIKNWIENANRKSRNLFKDRGVNVDILFFKNKKYLKNYYDFSFNPETGEEYWSLSQNGVWMPSREQLKSYGLKNLDYCAPANDEEFRGRVGRLFKDPAILRDYIWHVGP